MENLNGNLALILIGFVVIMHFAVWLEAILYKHGWQKILAFTGLLTIEFTGLLTIDIFLIGLLGHHHTLINMEVVLVGVTMIIFWNAKINIKESIDRTGNNDNT